MTLVMREFLRGVQKARGLTIGGLAELLGYKSQTSLVRIMQERANLESVVKFCQRMKECEKLALTVDEVEALDRIVERKRLSSDEYAATDVLRRLLQGDLPMADPVLIHAGAEERQTLLQRYTGMEGLRITLLNCGTVNLYGALAQLLRGGQARVDHYMYADQSLLNTTLSICMLLPILYEEHYYGAMAHADAVKMAYSPKGILLADVMLCEYERHGMPWYDLVIFQDENEGQRFTFPGNAATVHRMMDTVRRQAQPIRQTDQQPYRSYAAYLEYCQCLEQDRAVYRIKPDLGMEQIPACILRRAMDEGNHPLEDMDRLEEIMRARQKNAYTKKQAQHHVLKPRAMWKFVRTGKLSDHFFCMRPLTMKERMQTLQSILEQHAENPFFQLHFLKDEDAMRDEELICYDGVGLSIIKAGTGYDLHADHSEAMVTQPDFLRVYRSFFLHNILDYQVLPEHRTRKFLHEMIDYCQAHLEK